MLIDINSIIKAIPDRQQAIVIFTDLSGKRRHLDCVFNESVPPGCFLLFPPDNLPQEIDMDRPCTVRSQDVQGNPVGFSAEIVGIRNRRIMELKARKSMQLDDLRDYFRVNLQVQVAVFYDPDKDETDKQPLELEGRTIDISQSGVLTILPEECRIRKVLMLEINLPNPAETIVCSASIVRSKRIRKSRWLTAFHFENLSARSRDIIAKNCFAEQRRQLRENVRTA